MKRLSVGGFSGFIFCSGEKCMKLTCLLGVPAGS